MTDSVEATPAAPESGAISHDQLAGLFLSEIEAENAPPAAEPKAEESQPEAPLEAAEAQQELPRTEAAEPAEPASESQPEIPATPAIEPPAGMSEADKAHFAKLPAESQRWLSDRIKGQQADYTQKTQAVAQERQVLTQGTQALVQKLQHYDAILSKFANPDIAPPDANLAITDRARYDAEMANYVQAKHVQELAQKEQQRVSQERETLEKQNRQDYYRVEGQKLLEMNPDFGHPEKGPQLRKMAAEYAIKTGYSNQELQMASAKDMITLWKAAQYDAAQQVKATAKPVQTQPAPLSVKPGPAKAASRGGISTAVQNLA
jgi:hypothetical protein